MKTSKPPSVNGARSRAASDSLAELHAYRDRIAKRFNYDGLRILEYFRSKPLPPGMKVIEYKPPKKRADRKSA